MVFAYKIKVKTYSTSTIKRYHIIHYTNSEHAKATNCNIQNVSDEFLYQMTTDLNNNYKHVRLNIFGIIYFPPLLQSL